MFVNIFIMEIKCAFIIIIIIIYYYYYYYFIIIIVPLNKWPKSQYEGRIVSILTIQFDLKNKEITLACGLTSV